MQGGSRPGPASAEALGDSRDWLDLQAGPDPRATERVAALARTLENDIIPRLAAAHRKATLPPASNESARPSVPQADVEAFADAVLAASETQAVTSVRALRARGLSIESLLVDVFAPAARRLGEMWSEDRCDFPAVTVGLGRMQRLMRELSLVFGTEVAHPPNGRRALLVRAPGEQHSFGLSMVAEFFRRAGWEVAAGGDGAPVDPIHAVRREWFDVLGFTVGSDARLDWLPNCIAAAREASRNRGIAVLVGGPVFLHKPALVRLVGADATAADGSQAPAVAESLLAGRVRRH